MKYAQLEISSTRDLLKATRIARKYLGRGQIWWRGQTDFDWLCEPNIFRKNKDGQPKWPKGYEENIYSRFLKKAPSRMKLAPDQKSYADWLFVMQHYGMPTRLFDWTESPLIAGFFAVKEIYKDDCKEGENKDGALFAINPYSLNECYTGERDLLSSADSRAEEIINFAFDKTNFGKPDYVLAVRPPEIDARIHSQLSVFTLHGNDDPLDNLEGADKFLIKFKVLRNKKCSLLEELKNLGVRESNIYPDLEGLSREYRRVEFFRNIEENDPLHTPVSPDGTT